MKDKKNNDIVEINPKVYWISIVFCVLLYGPLLIFREQLRDFTAKMLSMFTHNLDWLWLVCTFACVIFLVWLAFSKYGNIKLGGPDDKPEFSRFAWLSMLFTGGVGAGLVHWAIAEPIYYLKWPPFWAEPFSAQAAQFSIAYGIFHWGIPAWGIFAPGAIAFAYMIYVRKRPYYYPSYACRGVLGDRVDGWLGKVIDIFVIVSLVGGLATTIGIVVPMIAAVTAHVLGVEHTLAVDIGILVVLGGIFTWSAYSGIYGGIQVLSKLNSYLIFILLGFIFLVGPTLWLLSFYVDSIGVLLDNFIRMSFYTDPITKSGFPQDWTVFYWAWWAAWAIYFGLFIARISKGRTIREVVVGMVFLTTLGCSIFFMVFGGYTVDLLLNQGVALDVVLAESGGAAAIVEVLKTLPLSKVILPFFLLVMFIFQATTIDSNAYIIASIACKEIKGTQQPPRWTRLLWGVLVSVAGLAVITVGGLQVVQLSSVLTSLPVVIIIMILMASVIKWVKEDFGKKELLIANYSYEEEETSNN